MRTLWSVTIGTLLLPALAMAQPAATGTADERAYVAVHVGGQAGSSDASDAFTFSIYEENATVDVRQEYGGGALFNIEGGYKVYERVFVGAALTRTSSNVDTRVDALVPNPLFFDAPRAATVTRELDHGETAFHLFGKYIIPVRENIEIGVSAGPSFIGVGHDVVTEVGVEEGQVPFSTVTITASDRRESETIVTINVGANVTYRLTPQIGIDGFFRFARGSADIDGAGTAFEVDAGGTQIGIGVRYGF